MINSVAIELDKPRRLRFDVNALADLEEHLGVGIGKVMEQEANFRLLRALLWAGLKWEEPRLTIERAGALIQDYLARGGDLDALAQKLISALLETSGLLTEQADEEPAEDPKHEA